MPDNFISTRTPGSRTSTYGLADHIADPDPHPQYLLKTDYAESGASTDGKLAAHMSDPEAHEGYLVQVSEMSNYLRINNFGTELAKHLYHDYTDADGRSKAASIKAVYDAHNAAINDATAKCAAVKAELSEVDEELRNILSTHRTQFAQGASTDHRDSTGAELYAHRTHAHIGDEPWLTENFALRDHNHDGRYALSSHTHDYVSKVELQDVGIYPTAVVGEGATTPFDFNKATTQGNTALSPDVFATSLNRPNISNITETAFLSVILNIYTEDSVEDLVVYGEQSCSQTLTTCDGIYYRVGHRQSASLEDGVDPSTLWTFTEWIILGGNSKAIFEVFYSVSTETPRGAFPLWTGESIVGCKSKYPSFWEKALEYKESGVIRVVDDTTYQDEIDTYGECGAFVIDETTGTIRLPKITSYISSIKDASNIGTTPPAAIPNIKGSLGMISMAQRSGPFDYTYGTDFGYFASEGYNGHSSFDASRVSPVYKDDIGDTVQPPSVCLALYIQVFNSITPTATTDLEARVGVLEQNAIMFSRHDFSSGSWEGPNSSGLYEYTFNTNHFTSSHIYMLESGGSVLVDESVEVHIVGSTETEDIDRHVKLVAPQAFDGYIITLG